MTSAPPIPADIRFLTIMRFFVAIYVVVYHYGLYWNVKIGDYTSLFSKGYLGVDFFFILSGAILCHVYAKSVEAGRFNTRSFIVKRFARLYPIHFVTLLIMMGFAGLLLAMGWPLEEHVPWERFVDNLQSYDAIAPQLLLLHGLPEIGHGWNYPAWSIGAEWLAYLAFPALSIFALKYSNRHRFFAETYVALLFAAMLIVGIAFGPGSITKMGGLWRIFFEFQLGIGAYYLTRKYGFGPRLGGVSMLALATLYLGLNHFHTGQILLLKDNLSILLIFALIVIAMDHARYYNFPGKASGALVYLGEISYGIYMWHAVVELFYFQGLSNMGYPAGTVPLALWVLSFAVVCGVASLGYHLVEVRGRRWIIGKWAKKAKKPKQATAT